MSGKELRELLASKGILQKDIARQLNITPGGFSQQLRAKDIKTGLLESICKVLNVKMDFFYGGTEYLEGYELIKQSDLKGFKSKLDQDVYKRQEYKRLNQRNFLEMKCGSFTAQRYRKYLVIAKDIADSLGF